MREKIENSIFFAYGFRPMFILLPIYMLISVILWSFIWGLGLNVFSDPIAWHMYELIFGVGSGGVLAFIFTAVPEMFPKEKPIKGFLLFQIVVLWIIGRFFFWGVDIFGVWAVAISNIPLLIWITVLTIKPIVLDPNRRHYGFILAIFALITAQILYFLSMLNFISLDPYGVLKASIGIFLILIFLAVRRMLMETVDNLFMQEKIEDTFLAKPPRYNLLIFTISLFFLAEFLFPENRALGWLAFACSFATLNLLNDFFLEERIILFKAFVFPQVMVALLTAIGFFLLGWDYLDDSIYQLNHFRHFLTTGSIGLAFYIVFVVVSFVHTGRDLKHHWFNSLGMWFIVIATTLRGVVGFFPEYQNSLYAFSALFFSSAFFLYLKLYTYFLTSPRADGKDG